MTNLIRRSLFWRGWSRGRRGRGEGEDVIQPPLQPANVPALVKTATTTKKRRPQRAITGLFQVLVDQARNQQERSAGDRPGGA